jgi:hypothetical protein
MLGQCIVQPWDFKGGALVTLYLFASLAAYLDFWQLLACPHKLHPRLSALGMARRFATTPFMACMHFFHTVVHLVHPLPRKVVTMEHLWTLVMALEISWLA